MECLEWRRRQTINEKERMFRARTRTRQTYIYKFKYWSTFALIRETREREREMKYDEMSLNLTWNFRLKASSNQNIPKWWEDKCKFKHCTRWITLKHTQKHKNILRNIISIEFGDYHSSHAGKTTSTAARNTKRLDQCSQSIYYTQFKWNASRAAF